MTYIDNSYWRYFLALEEEFLATQNFVEFNQENEKTFSIKYRSIILQVCSEIEKMCKLLCGKKQDDQSNMNEYRSFFKDNHPGFYQIKILAPYLYCREIQPWINWCEDTSPKFWQSYTEIKHEGKLGSATLKNAMDSLAGLFALVLAWYSKFHGPNFSGNVTIQEPKLFDYPGLKKASFVLCASNNIAIPGFEIVPSVMA